MVPPLHNTALLCPYRCSYCNYETLMGQVVRTNDPVCYIHNPTDHDQDPYNILAMCVKHARL